MKKTWFSSTRKGNRGFSLLELMVVIGIIFILGVLAIPKMATEVYAIRLKYSASDLSGVLQRARMESVRKNTFYSVQYAAGSPNKEQVVDKNQAVVGTIPPALMGNSVSVNFGTGSGAPGEAAFVANIFNNGQTVATAANGLPSFNARGLPCIPTGNTVCNFTVGQGFVFFLSGQSSSNGAVAWAAVAVTPSGRCEVWTYDGTNWEQQ